MALLLPPRPGVREEWTFGVGKHESETIDAVAASDPGYLRWAWSQEISDEAVRALEDCAEEHGFDLSVERDE